MENPPWKIAAAAIVLILIGCKNQGYTVIAASGTTIGVGISQQPTNGSVDATLGYKRAELAFVPTNRNSGENAGTNGGGAKDTGNVIMELRYSGIFSLGENSGIYQRLAVGDKAVSQNGASLLFAKGHDGTISEETQKAINAVKSIPPSTEDAEKTKAKLRNKHQALAAANDTVATGKFDAAVKPEFANFGAFVSGKPTEEKIEQVVSQLKSDGISID
jgi:uncharacterized lipoprotein NlpE involved in copper resistance